MSRRSGFAAPLPAGTGTFAGAPSDAKDKRLSLKQCRAFLPASCCLSEQEIEVLRDGLYALADIVTAEFVKRRHNRTENHFPTICESGFQQSPRLQVQ